MEGQEQIGKLYHSSKVLEKATSGGDAALSVVPMDLYWIWRRGGKGKLFGLGLGFFLGLGGRRRRGRSWSVCVCLVLVSGMGLFGGRCLLLNRVWAEYLQWQWAIQCGRKVSFGERQVSLGPWCSPNSAN